MMLPSNCVRFHLYSVRGLVCSVILTSCATLSQALLRADEIPSDVPITDPTFVCKDSGAISGMDIPLSTVVVAPFAFPVVLKFEEGRSGDDFMGKGWSCPLLESTLFKINENEYAWRTPDGKKEIIRTGSNDPHLDYTISTQEDATIVNSSYGWSYEYLDGHLASIKLPDKESLTFARTDDCESVVCDGRTLVEMRKGNNLPASSILTIEGKTYVCTLGKKPDVQTIMGNRVIGELLESLASIDLNGQQLYNFSYSIDPSKIAGTIAISKEGAQIKSGSLVETDEILGPQNAPRPDGAIDFNNPGRYITHSVYFQSGLLYGKIRSETVTYPDGRQVSAKYIYDENGKLIRTIGVSTP